MRELASLELYLPKAITPGWKLRRMKPGLRVLAFSEGPTRAGGGRGGVTSLLTLPFHLPVTTGRGKRKARGAQPVFILKGLQPLLGKEGKGVVVVTLTT
jgi:hypothetical protein